MLATTSDVKRTFAHCAIECQKPASCVRGQQIEGEPDRSKLCFISGEAGGCPSGQFCGSRGQCTSDTSDTASMTTITGTTITGTTTTTSTTTGIDGTTTNTVEIGIIGTGSNPISSSSIGNTNTLPDASQAEPAPVDGLAPKSSTSSNSDEDEEGSGDDDSTIYIIIAVVVVLVCCCIVALIFVARKRRQQSSSKDDFAGELDSMDLGSDIGYAFDSDEINTNTFNNNSSNNDNPRNSIYGSAPALTASANQQQNSGAAIYAGAPTSNDTSIVYGAAPTNPADSVYEAAPRNEPVVYSQFE